MKKVLIGALICIAIVGVGFGGFKLYENYQSKSKQEAQEAKEEEMYAPITDDEVSKADALEVMPDNALDDKGRAVFAELYNRYGEELETRIQVTDEEIDKYMAEREMQYPAMKLVVEEDGAEKVYYIENVEDLGENPKPGDTSPFGKIVSLGELEEADKREVVKAVIHNMKISNVLVNRIRNVENAK